MYTYVETKSGVVLCVKVVASSEEHRVRPLVIPVVISIGDTTGDSRQELTCNYLSLPYMRKH